MLLGQLDNHMQKQNKQKKLQTILHTIHIKSFKTGHSSQCKIKTMKILEENRSKSLCSLVRQKFLRYYTESTNTKEKSDKLDFTLRTSPQKTLLRECKYAIKYENICKSHPIKIFYPEYI